MGDLVTLIRNARLTPVRMRAGQFTGVPMEPVKAAPSPEPAPGEALSPAPRAELAAEDQPDGWILRLFTST